jgi:hypothetical protein
MIVATVEGYSFRHNMTSRDAFGIFSALVIILIIIACVYPGTSDASVKNIAVALLKINEAAKNNISQKTSDDTSLIEVTNNSNTTNAQSFSNILMVRPKSFGENTIIRSEPSANGKPLFEWESGDESELFVDSTPVSDKSNNSKWYKILFEHEYADFTLRQVHKLSKYNYSYGYVNANFVNTESLSDYDDKEENDWLRWYREEIAWTLNGRPPEETVGNILAAFEQSDLRYKYIYTFKISVTLLKKPENGSEEIKIPAGVRYIGEQEGTEDKFPVCYADMNEVNWVLIIDADTRKALGWMNADEWINNDHSSSEYYNPPEL